MRQATSMIWSLTTSRPVISQSTQTIGLYLEEDLSILRDGSNCGSSNSCLSLLIWKDIGLIAGFESEKSGFVVSFRELSDIKGLLNRLFITELSLWRINSCPSHH
ncbi:hypothetical protein WICPIJ_003279 [Wickerhamomyces pijperi]|uniref:Uncharacterized protein n=1 Tax=Wickerhamomyces pijperi TaxID=599730 RepID=A0A9P8TP14_WICPI|nr:hypothetical protein WICPIJ_003279 [Wickerhamomyces pijperi]